jgi:hypothetical protein
LHKVVDRLAVGPSGNLRHQRFHDHAHVLGRAGTDCFDHFHHQLFKLLGRQGFREKRLQDSGFIILFGGQVVPARPVELFRRFLALLVKGSSLLLIFIHLCHELWELIMDGLVLGAARFYPLHRAAHCAVVVQPEMPADLCKTLPAVASNQVVPLFIRR